MTVKSEGKCFICNDTFSKRAMTRHLGSCREKNAAPSAGHKKSRIFHIVAEGRYSPEYWLHIEAPEKATLASLDSFLRDMWLECCGHLSSFRIDEVHYSSDANDEWFEDEDIKTALGDVLYPGLKFLHEYDFGTTTELILKVISEREDEFDGKSVRLLGGTTPL